MLNGLFKHLEFQDNDYFNGIKENIEVLGYTFKTSDDSLFFFICEREIEKLKNDTNQNLVPIGLKNFLADRIISAFFNFKLSTNGLNDFNYSQGIKQVTMGDTSYTFKDGMTEEDMFIYYINSLGKGDDYICYRKFKW